MVENEKYLFRMSPLLSCAILVFIFLRKMFLFLRVHLLLIHLLYCHDILWVSLHVSPVIKPCKLNCHKPTLMLVFIHSTAPPGQQHLCVCLQEFEKYSVSTDERLAQWEVTSLTHAVPQALGGQISPDTPRDFFFFFFILDRLCLDVFCTLVPLPTFVYVQQ